MTEFPNMMNLTSTVTTINSSVTNNTFFNSTFCCSDPFFGEKTGCSVGAIIGFIVLGFCLACCCCKRDIERISEEISFHDKSKIYNVAPIVYLSQFGKIPPFMRNITIHMSENSCKDSSIFTTGTHEKDMTWDAKPFQCNPAQPTNCSKSSPVENSNFAKPMTPSVYPVLDFDDKSPPIYTKNYIPNAP